MQRTFYLPHANEKKRHSDENKEGHSRDTMKISEPRQSQADEVQRIDTTNSLMPRKEELGVKHQRGGPYKQDSDGGENEYNYIPNDETMADFARSLKMQVFRRS